MKSYWTDLMMESEKQIENFTQAKNQLQEMKEKISLQKTKMQESVSQLKSLNEEGAKRIEEVKEQIQLLYQERDKIEEQIANNNQQLEQFENLI